MYTQIKLLNDKLFLEDIKYNEKKKVPKRKKIK